VTLQVRASTVEDAEALTSLVGRHLEMPAAARDAAVAAFLGAGGSAALDELCLVCIDNRGAMRGAACLRAVALARGAIDVEWLVVDPDLDDTHATVSALLQAASESGRRNVRFLCGRWLRGGLPPHALDAAGMTRRGSIEDFFGPGDDLIVFHLRAENDYPGRLDPTSAASLHDAAFAYRDFDLEREFLLACAATHGEREVHRVASWSCGAGRHLRAFATRGIEGVGIEESVSALGLARAVHAEAFGDEHGTTWILSPIDQRVEASTVDLWFAMLSAVHRAGSIDAIVRHLRAAADLLAPGGVHVIEATHPVDATPQGTTDTAWTERRDEWVVSSRFRILPSEATAQGLVPTILDVQCRRHDARRVAGALHHEELWVVPDARAWREAVERAGRFEIAALLGDFRLDVPWDQPGAWRMMVVLRRTEES
jgi:hypothetical protein